VLIRDYSELAVHDGQQVTVVGHVSRGDRSLF